MKLGAMLVAQTLDQYDAKVISESHPAVTRLSQRFGHHTFFIDGSGLNIIEPAEADKPSRTAGVVVNIASRIDSEQSALEAHTPQLTDIVVELSMAKSRDPSAG